MNDVKTAHILIVDDDDSVRNSLVSFLEDYDYLISSSATAEHALELIKQQSFDIAIIDLRLPKMNGDQLIQAIYQITHAIRFLVHTGSNEFKLTPELISIGLQPHHIFLKPQIDLEPMVHIIEILFNEQNILINKTL